MVQANETALEGFPVLTDQAEQTGEGLAASPPGESIVVRETIFEEVEPWVPGRAIGKLLIVGHRDEEGDVDANGVFRFDEGSTLTVHGVLPQEGHTFGSGVVAITGGTGRYREARGQLAVDVRNPKRWG